jgi:hypothetical protein
MIYTAKQEQHGGFRYDKIESNALSTSSDSGGAGVSHGTPGARFEHANKLL